MTTIPHLALPFELTTTGAPVVEQGTVEEVAQCVAVLLATEVGERGAVPTYGAPDVLFAQQIDTGAISHAIATWEPRAIVSIAAGVGPVAPVQVNVSVDGAPPSAAVTLSVMPAQLLTPTPSGPSLVAGATYDGGNVSVTPLLVLNGQSSGTVLSG